MTEALALSPQAQTALLISFQVALWAVFLSLPAALMVSFYLVRGKGSKIVKDSLGALVLLPLVLPPVVTGYALLLLFGSNGSLGRYLAQWGLSPAFHWTGAAIAAGVMGFPLMVRAIMLSLEAVDPKLEEAAALCGLPRSAIFRRITLPLISPGIVVGATMGFAKALGEFGATLTFVGNIPGQTQTFPAAIYSTLQVPGAEAQVLGMVIWASLLAVALVLLSEALSRWIARRVRGKA